ncbi:MAG: diadenylate cyclase CdaA [Acidobacteriota bacterium]|nr:MAG: diadenylate cyclase CdaA [Acidobacteriota bacterium]
METLLGYFRFGQLSDPWAILQIALLWFGIYQVMLLVRRTRAVEMVYGTLAVVLMWWLTSPQGLNLKAVNWVLSQLLFYGPLALIVIFQQQIRQGLATFGRYPFEHFRQQDSSRRLIDEVALACSSMASARTGALIVFERVQGLRNFVETGISLDARVSYDLLINVFSPRTPLHDGAVIISQERIQAASCFLPLTTDPYVSRKFGTRHRAAIGITEETDAVAVVVSEERGMISIAVHGHLHEDLDTRSLRRNLERLLSTERSSSSGWRSLMTRQQQKSQQSGAVAESTR